MEMYDLQSRWKLENRKLHYFSSSMVSSQEGKTELYGTASGKLKFTHDLNSVVKTY